ncbi:MAG: peptidoglycan DD-metalloendopeptidase family protein [Actinobacteria bacterium]|nr:peptidoglycan DD-metalloendopeptidase family protein [Actinomycetota bacterium]
MTTHPREHRRRTLLAAVGVLGALVVAGAQTATAVAGGPAARAGAARTATLAPARPAQSPPPDPGGSASDLKRQYDEVSAAEAALTADVDATRQRRDELLGQVAALDLRVAAADRDLRVSRAALRRADFRDRLAQLALRRARGRLADAERALREQLVESYIRGSANQGALDAILQMLDQDPKASGSRIGAIRSYASAVVERQQRLLAELASARQTVARASGESSRSRRAAQDQRDRVAATVAKLRSDQQRTTLLRGQADQQLLTMAAQLQQMQIRKIALAAQVTALEKSSDGIQQMLAALQRADPAYVPGSIVLQSPNPGAPISSPFGMRVHPILGILRLHAGTDLAASMGTPILAPADGLVIQAGDRGGYGLTTVMVNGRSLATVFAHQSRIVVKPGQTVKRGDVVGYVGSTGLSTGPHLHFETRIRGVPIDPATIVDLAAPPPPPGTKPSVIPGG